MSEPTPVTFTADEQIKLTELEGQARGFSEFRNAVARSLHSGQDAGTISNLLQFLQNMALQSSHQIEEVKKAAANRKPEVVEEKSETKKKKAS